MAQPPRPQRFRQDRPVVDAQGRPTIEFLRNLNTSVDLANFLADLQAAAIAAQNAADVAKTAADNAQTAAETAQTAAEGAQGTGAAAAQETSLQGSYPANYTGALVSADSLGNVTIANHDRVYGNSTLNPTVAVTGNVIGTGFLNPTVVRIYYEDPTRAGGAVTYQATDDPTVAVQSGTRHSVGAVLIPAAGTQDGQELRPPGYVDLQ